jgi:RHS repeat-associated protein
VGYDDLGRVVSYTDADGARTLTGYDTRGRVASVTWTDSDGATTVGSAGYAYNDSGADRRGTVASVTDSAAGTITAGYDAGGALVRRTLPSGMAQSYTSDATGDTVATAWTGSDGGTLVSDAQVSDGHGRWRLESLGGSTPGWSTRSYGYDGAGRLTSVAEARSATSCVTRTYGWDVNSNRTSRTVYPGDADGACLTGTSPSSSQTVAVDAADRLLDSGSAAGIGYDAWGRVVSVPAGLTSTGAAGAAAVTYYAHDLVRSLSQGGVTRTWGLDPAGRAATQTVTGTSPGQLVNHYGDPGSDSPAWTLETTGATSTLHRYLAGPGGYLGEATTTAGTTTVGIGLSGLHGDVYATVPVTMTAPLTPAITTSSDEFGAVTTAGTDTTTTGARYGWLGTAQRPTDTGTTGIILMGVRLYAPLLGRFLTTDPVYGGNPTAYAYPTDPINHYDLDGRWDWWDDHGGQVLAAAGIVAMFSCTVCTIVAAGLAVYSVASATRLAMDGQLGEAAWELAGAVPFPIARAMKGAIRAATRDAAYWAGKASAATRGSTRTRYGLRASSASARAAIARRNLRVTDMFALSHYSVSTARSSADWRW